jgi:TIR domain
MNPDPIEVFFSYSHKDEKLREELEKHLSLLRRDGVIASWHDRKISAGTQWAGQIDKHLDTANVILLLISANFLSSDYCYDIEMKRAIERHDMGEARVIPIILRACDWKGAPFGHIQALPKDAKPVTSWRSRDQAFSDVAQGIKKVVGELMESPVTSNKPQAAPHVFQGTVTINGRRAPAGTKVTALIGGQEQASAMVNRDGEYILQVPKGNSTDVIFRVGTHPALQTAIWMQGGGDVLNLTVRNRVPIIRR